MEVNKSKVPRSKCVDVSVLESYNQQGKLILKRRPAQNHIYIYIYIYIYKKNILISK